MASPIVHALDIGPITELITEIVASVRVLSGFAGGSETEWWLLNGVAYQNWRGPSSYDESCKRAIAVYMEFCGEDALIARGSQRCLLN